MHFLVKEIAPSGTSNIQCYVKQLHAKVIGEFELVTTLMIRSPHLWLLDTFQNTSGLAVWLGIKSNSLKSTM